MADLYVTSEELALVKQNNQRRYIKMQVINRDWQSVGVIQGSLISCNVSIDGSNGVVRSANITTKTESDFLITPTAEISIDLQKDMPANYYIKLWAGIEDNNTLRVYWYNQGIYIIAESTYSYDPSTRTLSMTLVDLINDLNGERSGELHAYTSIVKNQQRIDDIAKNVMKLVGIEQFSIEPITVLRPANTIIDEKTNDEDFMVPYDIKFSTGVTAYEILDKLVKLYPYYEMGFDVNGTFFIRKELLEQDDSYVIIDAKSLANLVISEDTSFDWNYVKNHIEVWGKDGKYYGEAEDTNPESPFQIKSTKLRRLVVKDNEYGVDTNNICDRYKDADKANELLQKQAEYELAISDLTSKENLSDKDKEKLSNIRRKLSINLQQQKVNIAFYGDDLAQQWAERILYDRTRLQDNVTIKTICMPFLNDVNFKISYRSKIDMTVRPYLVKSINHDFAGGTTTINMIRFYNDMCSNLWEQLSTPTIISAQGVGMSITVTIDNVEHAETYLLYVNGNYVGSYTSTTIIYEVSGYAGTYKVQVAAAADMHRTSLLSDSVSVTLSPITEDLLVTNTDDYIITNNNDAVTVNGGD